MTKRRLARWGTAVAAVALTTAGLGGCGDDGDNADNPAPSAATAESTGTAGDPEATDAAEEAACTPDQPVAAPEPGTDPLVVGTLLPETGTLAYLGPPMVTGVRLAVEEINKAGGVLSNPVELVTGDEGDTTTDTANASVDRELSRGVDTIVGAAQSAVSLKVLDKIANAGVVLFSPGNTADDFTCYADQGQYFRTAPTNTLQAKALAELMAKDGVQRAVIMGRNDPYGTGLVENTARELQDAGISADQIKTIIYDPNAQSFNAEVDQVQQFEPDGIALIGFDESSKIITRLHEVGAGPTDGVALYGVDGNMANATGQAVAPGVIEGMKGVTPLTDVGQEFQNRLLGVEPGLEDFNYAGESYDAVIISALAAEQGQSTAGRDIAVSMNSITQDGENCTTFADCLALLKQGADIDYDGIVGPLNFTAAGEPGTGSFGELEFDADSELQTLGYVDVGE